MIEKFKTLFFVKSALIALYLALTIPIRYISNQELKIPSKEINEPKIEAPNQALEGCIRSNKMNKKDLLKKKTEKGDFYFFKSKSKI